MDWLTNALPALLGALIGGAGVFAGTFLSIRADLEKHRESQRHSRVENRFKAKFDAAAAYLAASDQLFLAALQHARSDNPGGPSIEVRAVVAAAEAMRQAGPSVEVLFGQAVRDIMLEQQQRLNALVEMEVDSEDPVVHKGIQDARRAFVLFVHHELTPDDRRPALGRASGPVQWSPAGLALLAEQKESAGHQQDTEPEVKP